MGRERGWIEGVNREIREVVDRRERGRKERGVDIERGVGVDRDERERDETGGRKR